MTNQPDEEMREYARDLFNTQPEPEPTGDEMKDFAAQLFHRAND